MRKIGSVGKSWGLKGYFSVHGRRDLFPAHVRIIWLAAPDAPEPLPTSEPHKIAKNIVKNQRAFLRILGLDSRTEVEKIEGWGIYITEATPEYLWEAYRGWQVISEEGTPMGVVINADKIHEGQWNLIVENQDKKIDIPLIPTYVAENLSRDGKLILKVSSTFFDDFWY